ncbi:beta-N-acetylhexosaminidase [Microbulbifer harenosus]|uniref:beta-N-acetylhexosaminidase n=1 Tax=Microbulbifer harenosus TaxID=2576840 RepID=A0ABY2UDX3_9GAMM|nr:family 20 glycosylhydrolase [Microbulbifer harenosus]TLM74439.1 N-acetyl-beta-hexosaminidase [Microbulbifer harenosus]
MKTIKNIFFSSWCALLPLVVFAADGESDMDSLPALMPYPQQLTPHSAAPEFILSGNSALCFRNSPSNRLRAAEARFRRRTERQTGISLNAATRCDTPCVAGNISVVELAVTSEDAPSTLGELSRAGDAYQLEINPQRITLSADFEVGILRGLQTLSQLLGIQRANAASLQPMTINDRPRFRWRGLMLDSARHFFSVDTIKRQLDGMAAAKLNVLHWHLTDDQSWRLQSHAYPRLHETAPGGNFYTREQVADIVAYAFDRGIVVVPEIDMPGHASAIGVAYPELMSAPGPYTPEDHWGVHKPLLNPANPAVYTFAEKVFAEVAELFPFEYVHIGGDEVNPEHWEANAEIQRFMQTRQLPDSRALHNFFNRRLSEILAGLDRKMIGWDEILHPGLAPDAAVQSWRGPDALGDIARAGHNAILSTGFYLDQPQYTGYHYRNAIIPESLEFTDVQPGEQWQTWQFSAPRKRGSPVSGTFTLIESRDGELRGVMKFSGKTPQRLRGVKRAGPYTHFSLDTWMGPLRARLRLNNKTLSGEFVVGNAPYHPVGEQIGGTQAEHEAPVFSGAQHGLTDVQVENILGGEAALWAEMVDEHTIDLRLWPRTFAVAERLWSGEDLQDEAFLYRRLPVIDRWAEAALGLQHRSQQAAALHHLFPKSLQSQALAFSAVLEPAHYYHRHHEKSVHETYSRRDPLNRFADSLPVESIALRELRALAESLPRDPTSAIDVESLQPGLLHLWRAGVAAQSLRQHAEALPADIRKLADLVDQQMELGFLITARFVERQPFTPNEEVAVRAQIASLKGMHGEVVLPAVYVLERFMDRLQYSGPGVNNNTDKQHD